MKYYTGIGSRETPSHILQYMGLCAIKLNTFDYVLRSGGAPGADLAFEEFASNKEIYLPYNGFNLSTSSLYLGGDITQEIWDKAEEIAAKFYHNPWKNTPQKTKNYMIRNVFQVLGRDLNTLSEFVICWTPDSKVVGGTAQAMKIAYDRGINVYNVQNFLDRSDLEELILNMQGECNV